MTDDERQKKFLEEVNAIGAKYGVGMVSEIQTAQGIDPMLQAIMGMLVSAGKVQAALNLRLITDWREEVGRPANSDAPPPNPRRRKR